MSKELRNALSCFATGVTIVTCQYEDKDFGLTCSSFNAVSLDPALVLWSLQHTAASRDAFLGASGYTVSVLAGDQASLALEFSRGTMEERFENRTLERAPSGRAKIPGCVAWFDCSLQQSIEAGDHHILLGQVEDYACKSGMGLIFERSRFGTVQSVA